MENFIQFLSQLQTQLKIYFVTQDFVHTTTFPHLKQSQIFMTIGETQWDSSEPFLIHLNQ